MKKSPIKPSMRWQLKIFSLCFLTVLSTNSLLAQSKAKIYITMITHNEENTYSQSLYEQNRSILVEIAPLFKQRNVTYNWQSDWTFLEAIAKYDNSSLMASTNNKNLARWLSEDQGVEIDPHAHESSHMYADVAQLIENLGVPSSKNVGGFLMDDATVQDWTQHENGTYSSDGKYFFKPDNLWGASTYNHQGADDETYGMWRPKDNSNFYTDDPTKHVAYIGRGCDDQVWDTLSDISRTLTLIDALNNGELDENGFYTASIMFRHQYFNTTGFVQKVIDALDTIIAHDTQGRLYWSTLTNTANEWRNNYGAQPFQFFCDSLSESQAEPVISYCSSSGQSSKYEYIKSITIGSTINASGNNNGYGDFTSSSINVSAGNTIAFKLTPGYSGMAKKEYIAAWIDFNQDGDFDDSGEEIIKSTVSGKFPLSKNISIPSSASNGNTRMRIALKNGDYPTSCEVFSKGEVEDYTLAISSSAKTDISSDLSDLIIGNPAFSIYPNPASNDITITMNSGNNGDYTFSVYDLRGKQLINKTFKMENASPTFSLNLQTLNAGSYAVCLFDNENKMISKQLLIKQ